MSLAEKIESYIFDKIAGFKKKYSRNYGSYFTPAENLCYTSMKRFKETFGIIERGLRQGILHQLDTCPRVREGRPLQKNLHREQAIQVFKCPDAFFMRSLILPCRRTSVPSKSSSSPAWMRIFPMSGCNLPSDSCDDCGYQGEIRKYLPGVPAPQISRGSGGSHGYLTGSYDKQFNPRKNSRD